MKILLLFFIVLITACSSQRGNFAISEGPCEFSEEQKELAWSNVTSGLIKRYPEHAKYCRTDVPASSKSFNIVNSVCRVYMGCSQQVNGASLLHGDWIVEINTDTQEVIEFYDVAW